MELALNGDCASRGGFSVAFTIFCISNLSVFSQNLLSNGNFETDGGSFADWDISHSASMPSYSGPTIASGGFNDPDYARFMYESEGNDVLSQSVPTTPGAFYDISFYAEDGAGHNFETAFGFGSFSVDLRSAFNIGPGQWLAGWTNFNFIVMATQTESDLSFTVAADVGSEFGVDDITVVAVPELQAVVAGRRLEMTVTNSNASVVLQVSTNLVNWVDVYTNTAPFTFTNSSPNLPRAFYRVKVSF